MAEEPSKVTDCWPAFAVAGLMSSSRQNSVGHLPSVAAEYNPKRRHGYAKGFSPVEFDKQYFNWPKGIY